MPTSPGAFPLRGQHEAIIFRRIKKDKIGALTGADVRDSDGLPPPESAAGGELVDTVELLINPYEANISTPRDVQAQRTSLRGNFLIQDWGPGLTKIELNCQTGNMLPYAAAIQNQLPGVERAPETIDSTVIEGPTEADILAAQEADAGVLSTKKSDPAEGPPSLADQALSFFSEEKNFIVKQLRTDARPQVDTFDTRGVLQRAPEFGFGYTGLLLYSPRFVQFLRLWTLYNDFDANSDVMLMTFSRGIFRVYFEGDFRFTIDANNPWNWKYGLTAVVIQGLDSMTRGGLAETQEAMNDILRDQRAIDPIERLAAPFVTRGDSNNLNISASPDIDSPTLRFRTPEDLQVAVIKGETKDRFDKATTVQYDSAFTGVLGGLLDSF